MKWKQFVQTPAGRGVAIAMAVVFVGAGIYAVMWNLDDGIPNDIHYSMYICTETGKTFRHKNQAGEMHPIESPYSGKRTGVRAEACYWTADGKEKSGPSWVLLNQLAGKPGPTFCPDCGRLVVGHNPRPGEGIKPPPNKQEYAASQGDRQAERASAREAREDDR